MTTGQIWEGVGFWTFLHGYNEGFLRKKLQCDFPKLGEGVKECLLFFEN